MKRLIIFILLVSGVLVYLGSGPIREFYKIPVYKGAVTSGNSSQRYSPEKQNIIILAFNKGTEIFDLIAPFYLFNLTNKANVFIVSPEKGPVALMKGFFILPHFTLRDIDSLGLQPAAIIIPNMSGVDKKREDMRIVDWIRSKYSPQTSILSVCAGSFTAAATGLYDGKVITTHASDMKMNKKLYDKPKWTQGVTFTKSGNLYSTAGVSNAVDGSLALIKDLFGEQSMHAVMQAIHYPHPELNTKHQSIEISTANKIELARKVFLKKRTHIGVLLQDNIDEFVLAGVLDAYHRTFPNSIKTFSVDKNTVTTKFGLVIIPTGGPSDIKKLDELHVLSHELTKTEKGHLTGTQIVNYTPDNQAYIFDFCLNRISEQYGKGVQTSVKRLLDYY